MSLKVNGNLEYYHYGKEAVCGTPEQPYAINLFIKDKALDVISLVPYLYHQQEDITTSIWTAYQTFHQTRLKTKELSQKVIGDNIQRGLLALVAPFGNTLRNWVMEKDSHHYSAEILHAMKDKKIIAGIAIEGTVVKTFDPQLLDTLTEDVANLTHARRLMILSELVKAALKTMSDETQISKEPLIPVVDVLVNTVICLTDATKATERDIKEIKKRVERVERNKQSLTPGNVKDLNTVNKKIRVIIQDRIKDFKKDLPKLLTAN